jgi:hypothetical protein
MARASYIRLDDDNIRFLLDQHAQFDFIVLTHINNSPLVDIPLGQHIILIPSQTLFVLAP